MPTRLPRLKWHRALPLVSLAVALGLLLVMLIGVDRIVADDLTRRARFRIGQAAQTYAEELNRDLSQRALALDLLANSGALTSPDAGPQAWRHVLQRFRERDPNFVWLGLVAMDGTVLAGSDGLLEGESIAHRPVFAEGRLAPWFGSFHPPVVLKPLLEAAGEAVPAEVADMAVPVRDAQGRVWAVLASHFDAKAFALLREDVLGPPDGRRAMELAIVNQGRDVVMGYAPLPLGHWPAVRPSHDAPATPVQDDGRRRFMAAHVAVGATGLGLQSGWSVLATQPLDAALAPAHTLQRYVLFWGAVSALLIGGAGAWLSRRLARPYADMLDAVAAHLPSQPEHLPVDQIRDVLQQLVRRAVPAADRSPGEQLLLRLLADAQRLGHMLDQMPAPIFLVGEDGRLVYWNSQAAAVFGWDASAAGQPFDALLQWPDGGARWPGMAASDVGPWSFDAPVQTLAGREVWGAWTVSRLHDAEGHAAGLLAQVRDLTAERQANQRLLEQTETLAAVIQASSDAVISTDEGGRIVLFNPAAERIFGVAATEMLAQPLDRLIPERVRSAHHGEMERFAASRVSRRAMGVGRVAGLRSDGEELVLEASISQTTVQGRRVQTAMLRDVTERVRAERAQIQYQLELSELTHQLMDQERATTRRLAQLLHDRLGQSLTALRLSCEALSVRYGDKSDLGERLGKIDRLSQLALAEVREALVDLRPPLLEDQGLVAALDNEVQLHGRDRGRVALVFDVELQDAGQRWPTDVEYAAFMIAREALTNALQHAAARSIQITLSGHAEALNLSVTDDGGGLPAEVAMGRPGHLGLVGMRERALAIHAVLTLGPREGGGTQVALQWEAGQ
ncbi:MAG: PAS domain S-box protein [Aquabacterium sp.]